MTYARTNKSKFILILFFIAAVFAACGKADENDPNNTNTDNRDVLIGNYTCQETASLNGTSGFTVKITKSTTNNNQIDMDNFYNLGFGKLTVANIYGTNVDIPNQTIVSFTIQGNGSAVANNRINLVYSVNDGTSVDSCSAVLIKQ